MRFANVFIGYRIVSATRSTRKTNRILKQGDTDGTRPHLPLTDQKMSHAPLLR